MTNNINKNTYRIYVDQNNAEGNFTNEDLLAWLHKQVDPFTFYRNMPASISRLSYSNEDSSVYSIDKNLAYIHVWNKDDQIEKGGKNYFDGMEYEVVGYIDDFTNLVANITPSLESNPTEPMKGEYYIDDFF